MVFRALVPPFPQDDELRTMAHLEIVKAPAMRLQAVDGLLYVVSGFSGDDLSGLVPGEFRPRLPELLVERAEWERVAPVGGGLADEHDEWAEGRRYLTIINQHHDPDLPAGHIPEAAAYTTSKRMTPIAPIDRTNPAIWSLWPGHLVGLYFDPVGFHNRR